MALNPRAAQQNTYPGTNGTEELDQGSRGGFLTISGRLFGATGFDVGAAEALIRSFDDGNVHTVVDQYGVAWVNCKLENFEPLDRVMYASDLSGQGPCYHRRYTVRFRILA